MNYLSMLVMNLLDKANMVKERFNNAIFKTNQMIQFNILKRLGDVDNE